MTDLFKIRLEITATLDAAVIGPNDYRVPEGVKIPVEISDGDKAFASHITSEMLQTAPDYSRDGRKAWLCRNLLKAHVPPEATLEVDVDGSLYGPTDAPDGPKVSIRRKRATGSHYEPVIVVNRRGEILLSLLRPDDPFPEFHGNGGNAPAPGAQRAKRRRQGDAQLRIRQVDRIRVRVMKG